MYLSQQYGDTNLSTCLVFQGADANPNVVFMRFSELWISFLSDGGGPTDLIGFDIQITVSGK